MSPKRWIETTNAIGIIPKSGRYGGGAVAISTAITQIKSLIGVTFTKRLK